MAIGIARFFTDSIAVETFQGTNSLGQDVFAAAVTVSGYADDASKLVRDSAGEQVVSSTTAYTDISNAPLFTPNSRVTVNGAVARVITASANSVPGMNLPDHCVVTLT